MDQQACHVEQQEAKDPYEQQQYCDHKKWTESHLLLPKIPEAAIHRLSLYVYMTGAMH
ncbi:MAG TPA: hypothetical protein VMF10_06885 [Candidatus Aquilonibacter sp.]|nr:hypothetical protein [Candidatus Aquilonibacter sp.]